LITVRNSKQKTPLKKSIIGTTNKRVVEICAGNGVQCMAANLIINDGSEGLLFDGEKRNIAS